MSKEQTTTVLRARLREALEVLSPDEIISAVRTEQKTQTLAQERAMCAVDFLEIPAKDWDSIVAYMTDAGGPPYAREVAVAHAYEALKAGDQDAFLRACMAAVRADWKVHPTVMRDRMEGRWGKR